MDNLRGIFPEPGDAQDFDFNEDEIGDDLPPASIGQDERRMQVRAYNFWAGMLGDNNFPAAEDLNPEDLGDFGPFSVLLDFTSGIENPAVAFLGDKLAAECGAEGVIERLSDVPSRSLLSRITDHYLQIIANQAPIGFEAEFVNQRGMTILYRGILLPYSSDNDSIDFIYGVINWKELADKQTADELLLEIDQALKPHDPISDDQLPMTDWAEGPVDSSGVVDFIPEQIAPEPTDMFPEPTFSASDDEHRVMPPASLIAEPDSDMELADWLASARDLADEAKDADSRTRQVLYAAVSRAYDFSLAAAQDPEEFFQLAEEAELTIHYRSPMVPVMKLVFGIDYDKTRLAEYAAALDHAHRLNLGSGDLAIHLASTVGGLKSVIAEERRLRRIESGKAAKPTARTAVRPRLAKQLRNLDGQLLQDIPADGSEFTLLVARRTPEGEVVVLGEAPNDISLIEKAAEQLTG